MQDQAREAGPGVEIVRELGTSKAHALIRELANHAVVLPAESESPDAAPIYNAEVVLQADVDGLRCVVTRRREVSMALSPREREIALLVAHGLQNKEVAERLHISVWTVNTHLRRIFGKLGVSSRAALARQMAAFEWFG
jgi:DNA-binding CsgD family transcriptional regulator